MIPRNPGRAKSKYPPFLTCVNISTLTPVRFRILLFVTLISPPFGLYFASDAVVAAIAHQTPRQPPKPLQKKFKAVRVGNGQTADGVWYSFTKFEAEDGSVAYNLVIPFPSMNRADEELQRRTKLATKIIRSNPQLDDQGKKVGQRVLAIYPGKTPEIPLIKLTWTIGSTFFEINSESMLNVLELEKQTDASTSTDGARHETEIKP